MAVHTAIPKNAVATKNDVTTRASSSAIIDDAAKRGHAIDPPRGSLGLLIRSWFGPGTMETIILPHQIQETIIFPIRSKYLDRAWLKNDIPPLPLCNNVVPFLRP